MPATRTPDFNPNEGGSSSSQQTSSEPTFTDYSGAIRGAWGWAKQTFHTFGLGGAQHNTDLKGAQLRAYQSVGGQVIRHRDNPKIPKGRPQYEYQGAQISRSQARQIGKAVRKGTFVSAADLPRPAPAPITSAVPFLATTGAVWQGVVRAGKAGRAAWQRSQGLGGWADWASPAIAGYLAYLLTRAGWGVADPYLQRYLHGPLQGRSATDAARRAMREALRKELERRRKLKAMLDAALPEVKVTARKITDAELLRREILNDPYSLAERAAIEYPGTDWTRQTIARGRFGSISTGRTGVTYTTPGGVSVGVGPNGGGVRVIGPPQPKQWGIPRPGVLDEPMQQTIEFPRPATVPSAPSPAPTARVPITKRQWFWPVTTGVLTAAAAPRVSPGGRRSPTYVFGGGSSPSASPYVPVGLAGTAPLPLTDAQAWGAPSAARKGYRTATGECSCATTKRKRGPPKCTNPKTGSRTYVKGGRRFRTITRELTCRA